MSEAHPKLLEVQDLQTHFMSDEGPLRAVDGVTFSLTRGKTLAIVGESGCGKSVTSYSILRLIQPPGRIVGGQILLHEEDGTTVDMASLDTRDERLYRIRGGVASMIFQEPMTALSPVHTIGNQITEAILLHRKVSRRQADSLAAEMLTKVGIPTAAERLARYPHELSGGMRQRVVIAMALVCRPQLLIADEPTTALDVTIQAQILRLMRDLQAEMGMSMLLITHNLGVVAQMADEVAVMYLGRIVEQGLVREVLKRPRHPYTKCLLRSLPALSSHRQRLPSIRGSVPALHEIPPGCSFHPRCPSFAAGRCDTEIPSRIQTCAGHHVACHLAEVDR